MPKERYLPSKLNNKEKALDFLDAWRVSRRGIYLPAAEEKPAVFVWSGRFVKGETVTMAVRANARVGYEKGEIFVGVVSEAGYQSAVENGAEVLEVYAEAAQTRANGFHGALGALMLIKGFPDGKTYLAEDLLACNMMGIAS